MTASMFSAVATHGVAEPLAGLLREPFRPLPSGPTRGWSASSASSTSPICRPMLEWDRTIQGELPPSSGGVRTMLFVPLRKDDRAARLDRRQSTGGAAVFRKGDRTARKFRRAGGDRDGQCPAA